MEEEEEMVGNVKKEIVQGCGGENDIIALESSQLIN